MIYLDKLIVSFFIPHILTGDSSSQIPYRNLWVEIRVRRSESIRLLSMGTCRVTGLFSGRHQLEDRIDRSFQTIRKQNGILECKIQSLIQRLICCVGMNGEHIEYLLLFTSKMIKISNAFCIYWFSPF